MESSKTFQKVSSVLVFCLESESERLWLVGSSSPKKERKKDRPTQSMIYVRCLNAWSNIKRSAPVDKYFHIWSSAQDYAVLDLLLNMVESFRVISNWLKCAGGNFLYQLVTSSGEAYRQGRHFDLFAWFIGAGGHPYACVSRASGPPYYCAPRVCVP